MFSRRSIWRLAIALVLTIFSVSISTSPVAAISAEDYFKINYQIELSQAEVHVDEDFYLLIKGGIACIKNVPVVNKVAITGKIIARHKTTGDEQVLNSGYNLTVEKFPKNKGDTYELDKTIKLRFPNGSPPGDYTIIGKLSQVIVNDLDFTKFITDNFSSYTSQTLGSVNCAALYTVSNFSITPTQVAPGKVVAISVKVTNKDNSERTYTLSLLINGVLEKTREVTLAPQQSQTVTFQVTRDEPGSYSVALNGLNGKFIVVESGLSYWLRQHWRIVATVAFLCLVFLIIFRRKIYKRRTAL